ncbi:MAG: pyrophosphorylase [Chloroflexi bacterium]|nr:pyrophosphorylase [Chloroflexota bacterium]
MNMRVVASSNAVDAIQQMQSLIDNDLSQIFQRINDLGNNVLLNPNEWDGRNAANFRGQIWPQLSASLRSFQGDLETLRIEIDKAVRAIMEAGGNAV